MCLSPGKRRGQHKCKNANRKLEGAMRLTASDIVSMYRPAPCQLRVYLREHHAAESEPGAYDEIIERLGRLHEQSHLASLGARVLRNLLDLLPITKTSVVLPLPSYSLKVVEQYVGFRRTQDEYGGSWAMSQFILATETNDEAKRDSLMAEILKYNEEDLAATWAVFDWLRNK